MSTSRRSTTGCTLCKTRRKKCDETKPQCSRCLASGSLCHYEYVECPSNEGHRVNRTKPAPRTTRGLLDRLPRNVPVNPHDGFVTPSTLPNSRGSATLTTSIPIEASSNRIYPSSNLTVPRSVIDTLSLRSVPRGPSKLLSEISLISPSPTSSVHNQPLVGVPNTLFKRLDPDEDLGENDPEGVQAILCRAPFMDKNVKENTLPFVLHCYSQWAIATVFEPRKIMHTMREQVIAQFLSENARTRSILIANVMNTFVKNFEINGIIKSILDRLAFDVRKGGTVFMATPRSAVPALDRQNAIRTLDSMLEILTLQIEIQPTSDCTQLFQVAVPVFRRACLEPPGRPINLPNILLDLSLNLRYFATMDIIRSLTTGLPTCFRYEVPFSLDLCERIYHWQRQGNYGLQWLYGLPDQFVLLFAWINNLSEDPGASENSELIALIERLLAQVKVATDESGDPALRIGRMAVQECWRYAVQIYLYLFLCRANARDPRVMRTQKGFMRLFRGTKPGRNPDLYLVISMVMVGVATIEGRDQQTLRQRILNIREYSEEGSTGNEIVQCLEDVWARTKDEGRAAVWSDLRIAYRRLFGI